MTKPLDVKPEGYRKLFLVEVNQERRSCRAVGVDSLGRYFLEIYEEYNIGNAGSSVSEYYLLADAECLRYLRIAFANGQVNEEDFDRLTAEFQ